MTTLTALAVAPQNPSEQAAAAAAQIRGAAEAARQDAANAIRQAEQSRQDAMRQAEQAGQAARQGADAGVGQPGAVITINTPDGRTITLNGNDPGEALRQLGIASTRDRPSDGPFIVATVGIVSSAFVAIVGLTLWYRARTRLAPGKLTALPAELGSRMERIENAVESIAVEVERISEGQRFTSRLLSERPPVEVSRD